MLVIEKLLTMIGLSTHLKHGTTTVFSTVDMVVEKELLRCLPMTLPVLTALVQEAVDLDLCLVSGNASARIQY